MKEVITLQIGKCGNNLGTQFWELLCSEHGLDQSGSFRGVNPDVQLQKIGSFFREIRGLRYTPRAAVIDLDRDSMETVKTSSFASIFRQDNFVYGHGGTGNNWAKGHHTEGVELRDTALEVTRKEAENTDCLQAFQVMHAIGGGTGSGLGSLIMDNLKDEYPGRNVSTFTVIPSPGDPKSGVEIYNSVLSLSHLIVHCDETFCMDNQSLHRICSEIQQLSYNLNDLNYVISTAISGITTSMRFQGQSNTDFRKIAVNFVPFPRYVTQDTGVFYMERVNQLHYSVQEHNDGYVMYTLHFFVPSVAPVTTRIASRPKISTVTDLFYTLLSPKKMFVDCDAKFGKFLAVFALFRGDVCLKDVVNNLEEVQNKNSSKFVEWVPDNAKSFVYELPSNIVSVSASMVANTTSVRQSLKRLRDQFYSMFRRRAFIEPFKSEGMEDMEFEEAAANLGDLLDEYKQSQVVGLNASEKRDFDSELE